LHQVRHGAPKTVADWLDQEGRAARFARRTSLRQWQSAPKALTERLDSTRYADAYAILNGDEAAREAGYPALGFVRGEGYDWACARAWAQARPPESWLA